MKKSTEVITEADGHWCSLEKPLNKICKIHTKTLQVES